MKRYRTGIRAGVPFALAAGLVGVSFGVAAKPVMGAAPAIAMSVVVFAGAAQFAATAVLAAGGGAAAAVLAGLMLNARFLPMGMAVAGALPGGRVARGLQGQAVVDASWAVAHLGAGRFDAQRLVGATIPQYAGWVAGTIVGVVGAGHLGDPKALGLDAIFPAFFFGLLLSEAGDSRVARIAALAGAGIALALSPVLPAGLPILIAGAAALIGARLS
jgi:predicted branched-subunit amino acid permease